MSDDFNHLDFTSADDHSIFKFYGKVSSIEVVFGEVTLEHRPSKYMPGEDLLNGWKFYLDHQCDAWVIEDPVKMRDDLNRAVEWAQFNPMVHGPCGECGGPPRSPEHHWRHSDHHRYTNEELS